MRISDEDRESATLLFGPHEQPKRAYEVWETAPPGSEEFHRLWAVWEEINDEIHANLGENEYCDYEYCDDCGFRAYGDDW